MLNSIVRYLNEVHVSRSNKNKISLAITMFVIFILSLSGTIAKIMGMGINSVELIINKLFMLRT